MCGVVVVVGKKVKNYQKIKRCQNLKKCINEEKSYSIGHSLGHRGCSTGTASPLYEYGNILKCRPHILDVLDFESCPFLPGRN